MKKKESQLLINLQESNSYPLFSESDAKLFQDCLLDYYPDLSQLHITYIHNSFEDYFEKLINLNHDQIILDELRKRKNLIKTHFISKIMIRLSTDKLIPLFKKINNPHKSIQMRLEAYIDDFLLFAGINYDVADGNIKTLKSKLQRRKRSNKTNEECKQIIRLLLADHTKYKAIQLTAVKFKDSDENVKSKFNNFCNTNVIDWQLKSDLIYALEILGTD